MEIVQEQENIRLCVQCGELYRAGFHNEKFCEKCKRDRKRARDKARYYLSRLDVILGVSNE